MGVKSWKSNKNRASGRHKRRQLPLHIKQLELELGEPMQPTAPPNKWEQIEAELLLIKRRLTALEQCQPVGKDDVSEQIHQFLKRMAGIKFNSGTIAANIGSNSMKISDKLKNLTMKGLIQHEKLEGLSAMYWYEIPETVKDVSE